MCSSSPGPVPTAQISSRPSALLTTAKNCGPIPPPRLSQALQPLPALVARGATARRCSSDQRDRTPRLARRRWRLPRWPRGIERPGAPRGWSGAPAIVRGHAARRGSPQVPAHRGRPEKLRGVHRRCARRLGHRPASCAQRPSIPPYHAGSRLTACAVPKKPYAPRARACRALIEVHHGTRPLMRHLAPLARWLRLERLVHPAVLVVVLLSWCPPSLVLTSAVDPILASVRSGCSVGPGISGPR